MLILVQSTALVSKFFLKFTEREMEKERERKREKERKRERGIEIV